MWKAATGQESLLSVSSCAMAPITPSDRSQYRVLSAPAAPQWRRAQCFPETVAVGSSDPRMGSGLQGCDPVSQAHLGEDHQQSQALRTTAGSTESGRNHRRPQELPGSSSDSSLCPVVTAFPGAPKESPLDFQGFFETYRHCVTITSVQEHLCSGDGKSNDRVGGSCPEASGQVPLQLLLYAAGGSALLPALP